MGRKIDQMKSKALICTQIFNQMERCNIDVSTWVMESEMMDKFIDNYGRKYENKFKNFPQQKHPKIENYTDSLIIKNDYKKEEKVIQKIDKNKK